ncbi:dATP/dGTP pyrophosphohydrolase domain-containing protein [Citrobacter freundii]|uniref:dATP/dGTP pyrophosphohydrolase domain-containing protein n=1 Tax=Citrobacter freundii TaxID=546 RepID=UPI0040421897
MADAVKVINGVLESMAREQVRREHATWSQATFGDVGPVGPLKHLSKEALEAAAEPGDLSEWADMQFLLWDAQRRAGISDEQITHAMVEKLAVNKQREWPEPKDGEPRLHIKAQVVQVVPTFDEWLEIRGNKPLGWVKDAMRESYDACRAAMLQAGTFIDDGTIPVTQIKPVADLYAVTSPTGSETSFTFDAVEARGFIGGGWTVQEYVELERYQKAVAGNSPVTQDGWIPVSERMPENKPGSYEYIVFESLNNRAHHDYWNVPDGSCDDFSPFWNHYGKYVTHWMPLPAAPQQEVKSALEHGMQRYAGAMQKLSEGDD